MKYLWGIIGIFFAIVIISLVNSRTTYTVQPGDSWWSIANQLDTTVEKLEQLNGRSSEEMLYTGEQLKVPYHTTPAIETQVPKPIAKPMLETEQKPETTLESEPELEPKPWETDPDPIIHTVREGESLTEIARYYSDYLEHNFTVWDLIYANPQIENPDDLKAGETIIIPLP
ncbi:MAG: LysM peptidoglycan-binding domain-containing protein [Clostridia bacterium]|nr:LysM peptidoglycan-binding domain-containing protein [Clostridia bacterium]